MKLLVLSALLAFTSAVYQGRNILLQEDGTIYITGLTGQQFVINKQYGEDGQNHIYIVINGYDVPLRRILINDQYCNVIDYDGFDFDDKIYLRQQKLYGSSQIETLYNIFRNYQGSIDDYRYAELLKTIDYGVTNGRICRVIYDLLERFDSFSYQQFNDKTVGHQGGRLRFFGKQIIKGNLDVGQRPQYGVRKNYDGNDYNKKFLGGDHYDYSAGYRGGFKDNKDVDYNTRSGKDYDYLGGYRGGFRDNKDVDYNTRFGGDYDYLGGYRGGFRDSKEVDYNKRLLGGGHYLYDYLTGYRGGLKDNKDVSSRNRFSGYGGYGYTRRGTYRDDTY